MNLNPVFSGVLTDWPLTDIWHSWKKWACTCYWLLAHFKLLGRFYLWCNVVWGPAEGGGCDSIQDSLLAHPKVCQLAVTLSIQQDVVQLQVSAKQEGMWRFVMERISRTVQDFSFKKHNEPKCLCKFVFQTQTEMQTQHNLTGISTDGFLFHYCCRKKKCKKFYI